MTAKRFLCRGKCDRTSMTLQKGLQERRWFSRIYPLPSTGYQVRSSRIRQTSGCCASGRNRVRRCTQYDKRRPALKAGSTNGGVRGPSDGTAGHASTLGDTCGCLHRPCPGCDLPAHDGCAAVPGPSAMPLRQVLRAEHPGHCLCAGQHQSHVSTMKRWSTLQIAFPFEKLLTVDFALGIALLQNVKCGSAR